MPKPQKHLFVCVQARPAGHPRGSCGEKGCADVWDEVMFQLQEQNAFTTVAVTNTGCLGPCGMGPNLLVYPEGILYNNVKKEDVAEIFKDHLLGDKPVERLIAPAEVWG